MEDRAPLSLLIRLCHLSFITVFFSPEYFDCRAMAKPALGELGAWRIRSLLPNASPGLGRGPRSGETLEYGSGFGWVVVVVRRGGGGGTSPYAVAGFKAFSFGE